MNTTPRTELGDITSAGMELDESELSVVSGGQMCEVTMYYLDPPGYCALDRRG
ncbi:hypothetical protein ABZU75_26585 [Streptosporangium sp. NPDC005286]|uniref:hypothetical protein n=1 Tax=Streptosporangium sp. NPDC005286 TaxID=3154463 RepID=UPI0033AFCF55